ncbi:single-stranded DNA-binding protein [Lysinibacillus telephonicus]|uniref:single-stranded DNA-binding protein n=1 Tax=Lysinibacillus telephonicus TaxID=1714840 RepID=UPI0031FD9CA2
MINSVVLVGRLTKDPELRYTPSGVAMCRFTVAVNRAFSNEQGEREADFIQCLAWRKQAENLANFMRKGSLIGIEGRIQTGSFEGQDGKRVYTTDVVANSIQFLEPRGTSDGSNSAPNYQGNTNYQSSNQNANTGQYGGQNTQHNYVGQPTNYGEDPFANSKGPIEVSGDDLPF